MKLKLYHYWRSSSSWRVRWALAHKGIPCEFVHVSLLSGESEGEEHRKRNPLGFVPVLDVDGKLLTESVAILEWLEEIHPESPLYPKQDPWKRARVRQLCETINASTQPVQSLNVLEKLSDSPEVRSAWAQHFIRLGLSAYEILCREIAGRYSFGDSLTAADLYLIPQLYNSARQGIDVAREFPRLHAISELALQSPSAQASHPDRFRPADAPKD